MVWERSSCRGDDLSGSTDVARLSGVESRGWWAFHVAWGVIILVHIFGFVLGVPCPWLVPRGPVGGLDSCAADELARARGVS